MNTAKRTDYFITGSCFHVKSEESVSHTFHPFSDGVEPGRLARRGDLLEVESSANRLCGVLRFKK